MTDTIPVEKKFDETAIEIGACKFCGQCHQIEVVGKWTDDMLNEAATERCKCEEAGIFRVKKRRKEKAERKIIELFREDCGELMEMMKDAVNLIMDGPLNKVVFHTETGVKATISVNNKGNIKIERSEAIRRSSEI